MEILRHFIVFFVSLYVTMHVTAQQTIKSSLVHDGLTRTFSYYLPKQFSNAKQYPLVLNLHGYTSNGDQQEFYGDFRKIADTAGFIVVHPNGSVQPATGQTFWNCGLIGSSNVDDIGFLLKLIDELSKTYNIDQNRIYSTGMSNGGFMSYHLACKTDRFAAIASVTGSMTELTKSACSNASAIPVMEIHGDNDPVVNYNGAFGFLGIPAVIDFWIKKNNLDKNQVIKTQVPNINTTDNAQAELTIYPGKYELQHYKVINGGHTWPGATFSAGTTCQDFSASKVIWDFFKKYSKQTTSVVQQSDSKFLISPNPASHSIHVQIQNVIDEKIRFKIIDVMGVVKKEMKITGNDSSVDIFELSPGIYYVLMDSNGSVKASSFVKL